MVFVHLRPLSPPNMLTSAPWLMNSPLHRKAGSSGFPLTGSTKPSMTVSAPWATAFTNALLTWKNGHGFRQAGAKAICRWLLIELTCGCVAYLQQSFIPVQPFLQSAQRKVSGCLHLLVPVRSLWAQSYNCGMCKSQAGLKQVPSHCG